MRKCLNNRRKPKLYQVGAAEHSSCALKFTENTLWCIGTCWWMEAAIRSLGERRRWHHEQEPSELHGSVTLRPLCNVKSNVIRRQAALWHSLWAPLVHEVLAAPAHPWPPVETRRSISVRHRGFNQWRMLLRKPWPWQNTVSFELDSPPQRSTQHYLHTAGLIKYNAFAS